MAVTKTKASDKQAICKKLVRELKKRYKGPAPAVNRPVLETMLFAVCLEDASIENAEAAYERLFAVFHDLNEIRVSSITELAVVFQGMPQPERRAHCVRSVLRHIFEKFYSFDFEPIRRKTLDLATRQLAAIDSLSYFVRAYALQSALDAHILPLDQTMANAVVWLGLAPPAALPEVAGDTLRAAVRKPDAKQFCHLLKRFATDPQLAAAFDPERHPAPEGGYDLHTAPQRTSALIQSAGRKKKPAARKKSPARKTSKKRAGATRSSSRKKTSSASARKKSAQTKKKKTAKRRNRSTAR